MAIQFELYKSPARKDEEDKELYHARVVNFQHRLLSGKAEQSGTDHLAQAESKPNETQSKHRLQGG